MAAMSKKQSRTSPSRILHITSLLSGFQWNRCFYSVSFSLSRATENLRGPSSAAGSSTWRAATFPHSLFPESDSWPQEDHRASLKVNDRGPFKGWREEMTAREKR